MQYSSLSEHERNEFLAQARVASLSWLSRTGTPISAPVWYEWDGVVARMFSDENATKVRALGRDSRACLLVCRPLGEHEEWVAIDGRVTIRAEGTLDLIERLARRYWDLTNETYANELRQWRDVAESFVVLCLTPTKIRSYVAK